jgi:hypothetical protein
MLFLVTGASGGGRTTVRKLIEAELAGEIVACELATLGLTPQWTLRWRHKAVEQAVQRALREQEAGKDFLLCGEPVPPGELYAAPSATKLDGIQVCLLDVSPDAQVQRKMHGDPADLIPFHVAFAEWMRHHVRDHRCRPEVIMNEGWEEMRWDVWTADEVTTVPWQAQIIDMSNRKPVEVANAVASWRSRLSRLKRRTLRNSSVARLSGAKPRKRRATWSRPLRLSAPFSLERETNDRSGAKTGILLPNIFS